MLSLIILNWTHDNYLSLSLYHRRFTFFFSTIVSSLFFFLTIVAKTLATGFWFLSIFLEQFFSSYLIHHPLSISAESRLKMPLEYTPLSHLNSSQKEWKIRVLVSRVWNYYSKNKPEVVLGMEAILVDEKVYTLWYLKIFCRNRLSSVLIFNL